MHKIPSIPDHFQDILQNRMKDQFEPLFDKNGEPKMTKNLSQESVHVGFCKKTGHIYGGERGFYILGYREYLEGDEQRQIWDWIAMKIEKSKFEKANKIKYSDWKGEQFFDGNDFFIDLDDFFEGMIEEHGFQYDLWQDYVWAIKPNPIIKAKDAFSVYEADMECLTDEYDWNINGVGQLQEALNEFVEANKETND